MKSFATLLPTELRRGIPGIVENTIPCKYSVLRLVSHCGFLGSCLDGLIIPAVECWLV